MTTDTYMKNYCAAMDRLEQLEKALDGLDLFMDVWEDCLDTVTPDGSGKTLQDVQAFAHIYLDGFRAALAEPVEIPEKSENTAKPDAAVSDANAVQATVNAEERSDHE